MNKSHYTKDGRHPEDVIYQEREFIREINEIVNILVVNAKIFS
jgi:hypothetical protein